MENVRKDLIIELLRKDNTRTPKNAPTNCALIEMLENSNLELFAVSPTRSGGLYNRGEIVELIIKALIFEFCGLNVEIKKSQMRESDLNTLKLKVEDLEALGLPKSVNIEVKLTSSIANASVKSNKARWCLIVNLCAKYGVGAYLVESKNLIKDKHDHITPQSVVNGVYLDLITELLGL